MRWTPPCLGLMFDARRTNWKRRAICLLKEVVGGRLWISLCVLFLPNGLEGESKGRKGYGVYGVCGVANVIGPQIGLLEENTGVCGKKACLARLEVEGNWGDSSALRFLYIFKSEGELRECQITNATTHRHGHVGAFIMWSRLQAGAKQCRLVTGKR